MHLSNPFVSVNVPWASGLNAARIFAGMAVRPFASTEYSACPLKRAMWVSWFTPMCVPDGNLCGFVRPEIWLKWEVNRWANAPLFPTYLVMYVFRPESQHYSRVKMLIFKAYRPKTNIVGAGGEKMWKVWITPAQKCPLIVAKDDQYFSTSR